MIIRRLWRVIAGNLRYKLLFLVLVPMLLLTPTVMSLASFWTWNYSYQQLFRKVSTDLSVAHDIFQRIQTDRQQQLRSLAESYSFRRHFETSRYDAINAQLTLVKQQDHLDFLILWSASGTKVMGRNGWEERGIQRSPLVDSAISGGVPAVGIEILEQHQLQHELADLAERVKLPLVDTPRAVPTNRSMEDRAMLIRVLQPILDEDGKAIGLLEGGVLLNGNFSFVDEIRDLVYGPGSLAPGSLGTVTVFLDDVRVTTNVPGGGQQRALGTRVSEEVRTAVLENREVWVKRAFVVNDWYISAYEPIIDVYGNSVGMLYAGFLEAPLRAELKNATLVLAALLVLGTGLAAIAAIIGAQSIFRPIESIANVVSATQVGKSRRIGVLDSRDEIGKLARQFDSMLDTLEENQRRIQHSADELELKVQERTSELSEKNKRLQESVNLLRETRQQLAMAEKLAALGELTAGVAHEINNPTAVILGNMDVVIAEIGDKRELVETEIDLIVEQVYRIRSIVDRLLQYSRPSAYAGYVDELDISEVLRDTVLLVRHELEKKNIRLIEQFADLEPIQINQQELQQVLVNLMLNAAHAVTAEGEIRIETSRWGRAGVAIRIRDNGIGIPPDELGRVFDPFYTFGKEQGTGLGLSVSYGIIRRYGGRISVDSLVGEWTEFTILLRFEPVFEDDDELLLDFNRIGVTG